jgi:hypothetical protein
MPKAKYVISRTDNKDSAAVYDDADLKRRTDAAKKAGVDVKVRKL